MGAVGVRWLMEIHDGPRFGVGSQVLVQPLCHRRTIEAAKQIDTDPVVIGIEQRTQFRVEGDKMDIAIVVGIEQFVARRNASCFGILVNIDQIKIGSGMCQGWGRSLHGRNRIVVVVSRAGFERKPLHQMLIAPNGIKDLGQVFRFEAVVIDIVAHPKPKVGFFCLIAFECQIGISHTLLLVVALAKVADDPSPYMFVAARRRESPKSMQQISSLRECRIVVNRIVVACCG